MDSILKEKWTDFRPSYTHPTSISNHIPLSRSGTLFTICNSLPISQLLNVKWDVLTNTASHLYLPVWKWPTFTTYTPSPYHAQQTPPIPPPLTQQPLLVLLFHTNATDQHDGWVDASVKFAHQSILKVTTFSNSNVFSSPSLHYYISNVHNLNSSHAAWQQLLVQPGGAIIDQPSHKEFIR